MGIVGDLMNIVVLRTVILVLASLEIKTGYSYLSIAIVGVRGTK